ncbi:MAG: ABC transporter substrate-binding protein [Gemmatimonadetes bacterium]|nr:ABC transporter substrate-binding protein [Gemmatimonadota bacterium]
MIRIRHGLALFWFATILSGCGSDTRTAATPHLDTVRVANATGLSQAAMSLAAEAGYFREAGVAIEFVPVRQHEDVLVALLTNKLDAAVELFQAGYFGAMVRGGAMKFITSTVSLTPTACPYVGVVLRPGLSPADAPRHMHKLRVSSDGMFRYLMSRDLESQGLQLASFELVRLQAELAEQALTKGTFDAAILAEPFLSRATRSGTFWLRSQDATPNVEIGGLLVGERLLTRDRGVGIRFLAAYRRGVATFSEGKTAANLAALQRATGLDSTSLANACWPTFRADGRMNLDGVMAYQQWLVGQKLAATPATPAQFWDSTLVAATDTILLRTSPRTPQ